MYAHTCMRACIHLHGCMHACIYVSVCVSAYLYIPASSRLSFRRNGYDETEPATQRCRTQTSFAPSLRTPSHCRSLLLHTSLSPTATTTRNRPHQVPSGCCRWLICEASLQGLYNNSTNVIVIYRLDMQPQLSHAL